MTEAELKAEGLHEHGGNGTPRPSQQPKVSGVLSPVAEGDAGKMRGSRHGRPPPLVTD